MTGVHRKLLMPGEPGIRVTVEDLKTGDRDSVVIQNDYVVVCAGTCLIAHQNVFKNGTHQLTIKGRGSRPHEPQED